MRTDELSVSFMKKGSAVIVGPKDEQDAISLYNELLGKETIKTTNWLSSLQAFSIIPDFMTQDMLKYA